MSAVKIKELEEVAKITNQIIQKYNPLDIIVFGSYAKGLVTFKSDLDICVIIDTDDRKKLAREMLLELEYDIDLDIVVYTPDKWEKYKEDESTFANVIKRTGVSVIG